MSRASCEVNLGFTRNHGTLVEAKTTPGKPYINSWRYSNGIVTQQCGDCLDPNRREAGLTKEVLVLEIPGQKPVIISCRYGFICY